MANYSRPSLAALDARIRADLAQLPAVLRVPLSHAWSRACHGLHGHIDWADRQNNPLTCELERLYDWAALYGVARLAATPASGTVLATGSPGSVVLADALLRGTNGLDYKVQAANFMANSGVALVFVRAVESGEDSNLPAGAALTLVDPLPGIASTLTVGDDGLSGGAAEETLDDWRLRVADEWQAMTVRGARGGRVEDYRFWAQSAHPSVSGALVFTHTPSLGMVVVRPICDTLVNRLPSAAVLAAVSDYLAGVAPATADWRVVAPEVQAVNIVLHLDPGVDNADARSRIARAILAAVLSEKTETSILNVAEIDAAVATVTDQYTRLAPLANVAARPGDVLVLAGVVWQ
jgi:uncharacterized phage protein gp47/JayE